jgi:2-oxoglutarate ferredoxin oxidoreductase subunit alpha
MLVLAVTGDAPRVVIAPSSVEDAFYTAIEAVNMARKYKLPVFVLSDQANALGSKRFLNRILRRSSQDISPDFSAVADYKPYDLDAPDGIVPRIVPGTPIASGKLRTVATGSNMMSMDILTGSPKLHMQMTAKRRKSFRLWRPACPVPKVYGPPEGNVLLIGWGSTKGPIQEAVDRARSHGDSVFFSTSQALESAASRVGKYFLRV